MILKITLAKLLARQNMGVELDWDTLEPAWKAEYEKDADEVIQLFTNAIKSEEL